jgi:hypothetical protein
MSDELLPAKVRLTDGLGPLPEDALRQQAFVILSRLQSGTEDVVRLDTALATVAAERERWTEAVMAELDGNGQAHAIVAYATRA